MAASSATAIAVQALVVLFLAYRSVQAYRGRQLSPARLFVFPVFTLLVFVATEAETVASIPSSFPLWAVVDAVVLVAAAVVTVPLAPRFVRVSQGPSGEYVYRYGIELIGLYLGLWVVRFALAAVYDPSSLALDFSTPSSLSGTPATVMLAVQTLFAISSGVVVGRSVGTYRLYERRDKPPPVPGA